MNEKVIFISENEKYKISHYVEEWKILNQYLNDIDKGYVGYIKIFIALATAITAVTPLIIDSGRTVWMLVFYALPMAIIAIFGVMSYQFRITAILRGHLSEIEDKINDIIGENVYMWNSSLTEVYMAHNNIPNNFLIVPILVFVLFALACCFCGMCSNGVQWYDVVYWLIFLILGLIVLIPFFYNETIRKKTYDSKDVIEKYKRYKK